ncbi:T9SS type A sorting domain-containing protein [Cytophaga aurantiaca]|uniref:T9SS type A sorting domain-containing protein n=1 Tax=Cytophaga aurantiaca TaxID=29530 RepID=UPI00036DD21B|nr:T9SS type A sorting domain-containing protein [Cytophaga aurantiaca]
MKKILLAAIIFISAFSVGYSQCTPSVTITADKTTICLGEIVIFTATQTNGGTSPSYTWKKNNAIIASATNSTYTTSPSDGGTYTAEMLSSESCANSSSVVSNAIVLNINTYSAPSIILSQGISSGKSTACPNTSIYFGTYSENGGTTPLYEWFINNTSQGPPSPNTSFTTTALTSNTDVVRVTLTSNIACVIGPRTVSSLGMFAHITPIIGSGTIGTNQTICYNSIPPEITETAAPTNIIGIPTYTWEASADGAIWSVIPGASGSGYTPPPIPLTQDTYIRRTVTDPDSPAPCNTATSNVVHITVRPILTAGVISGDETICSGSTTATIVQTTAPIGGTVYSYQWEASVTGSSFSNIVGATNSNYNTGALTVTTYYRRKEISNFCGTTYTNVVTKTVGAPEIVTAVIDNAPNTVCAAAGSIVFTANGCSTTGMGILHYQWFLGSNLVGTDNPTYTLPISVTDNGKIIKVLVSTSTSCNAGTSSATYTLDIVSAATPTVSITTNNNPVCIGMPTTFTVTTTGGGAVPAYQWYVVPSGSSAGTIGTAVGTGGSTYSSSSLHHGDQVYVMLTSTSVCLSGPNPFKSNSITMSVKPIPSPVINEGDQTVCSPNSFTYHAIVGSGTNLQWTLNATPISGATTATYTATQSGTYSIQEDNGTCNATSAPVQFTVVSTPLANAGPDQYVLAASIVTLNASGGTDYSWSPSTYLSNTAIANPTLTADQTIIYTVTVSNHSGAATCSTSDDVTVYVSNAPAGSFSTSINGPNPIMSGQQNARYSVTNQPSFTYTWSVTGGTIVSGQNTNSVVVDWDDVTSLARTTAAAYSISVVEKNSTNQTKKTKLIINTISTGTTLSQAQSGIKLFPNPTTESFNIEMPESGLDVSYEILDLTGLVVATGTFTSNGSNQKIDADFGAGMYQVILKYDTVVACVRLSKIQ